MNILLLIIIGIIVAVLFFTLLKSILKAALFALGVCILIVLIVGVIAYSDLKQASEILEQGEKTIIYADGDEFLAGVHASNTTPLAITITGELSMGVEPLGETELEEYKKQFFTDEKPLNSIIIVIDKEWLWESIESIQVYKQSLTQNEVNNIMTSTNPEIKSISDKPIEELRGTLLLALLHEQTKTKGTGALIKGLHNKDIQLSQKFISLEILSLLPQEALDQALDKTLSVTRNDEEAP